MHSSQRFASWLAFTVVATSCASSSGPGRVRSPNDVRRASPVILTTKALEPSVIHASRAVMTEIIVGRSPRADRFERAKDLVRKSKVLYRELRFEESLATIVKAQMILQSSAVTSDEFDVLRRALLLRGMNEIALGHKDKADQALLGAIHLLPSFRLDEGNYPPEVRAAYERLRSAALSESPAALAITSEPTGADVRLNGQAIGKTPTSAQGSPGLHFVSIEAAGFSSQTLPVSLSTQGGPALHIAMRRASPQEAADRVMGLPSSQLPQLSRESKKELAVVFRASRVVRVRDQANAIEAVALDLESGEVKRAVSTDADRSPSRRIEALLLEISPSDESGEGSGGGVFSSPYFWVGAGVVVLAGAAVLTYALTRDPAPTVGITPNP